MGRKLPREMRKVFNQAAVIVANEARPNVPVRTGRLSRSIKPASTQKVGRVAYATPNSVPYAGFIEFGGAVGKGKSVKRPYVKKGRYLFPAAERQEGPVAASLEKEIGELIKRAGLG